jgi:hypothetical protein
MMMNDLTIFDTLELYKIGVCLSSVRVNSVETRINSIQQSDDDDFLTMMDGDDDEMFVEHSFLD